MDIPVFLAVRAWTAMPFKHRPFKAKRWISKISFVLASGKLLGAMTSHTIYSRNNMGQKCEGNCGLWVLNEIIFKIYPETLKKIVGAIWELPAK